MESSKNTLPMKLIDALTLTALTLTALGWCGLLIDYTARRVVTHNDKNLPL